MSERHRMKILQIVKDKIESYGVSRIVEVVDMNNPNNTLEVADARSAAFMAMGIAIRNCETCGLMVSGEYITSILTAVTEAWFQKADLLVVGLFNNTSDIKTSWIDRYLVAQLNMRVEEFELKRNEINSILKLKGPKMLSVFYDDKIEESHDYGELLKNLYESSGKNTLVTCYDSNPGYESYNAVNISRRYKYGVISKYIGSSLVVNSGILVCTPDCLVVDVNVFRTKYKNSNMKIVIHDTDGIVIQRNIDKWIVSNGWNYSEAEIGDIKALKSFLNNEEASVFVVR